MKIVHAICEPILSADYSPGSGVGLVLRLVFFGGSGWCAALIGGAL